MTDTDRGPDEGGLLSVPEVVSHPGVSGVTVWRLCRDGSLPALSIGKRWRVRREQQEALDEVVEARRLVSIPRFWSG